MFTEQSQLARRTRCLAGTALGTFFVLAAALSGCWWSPAGGPSEQRPDAMAPGPGTIAIYLTGDATPYEYADGLSGQTPQDFVIALGQYYLQTSIDDPTPVLCFDHGDWPAEARLDQDNLVGVCDTSAIPTAVYTHGRVKVEWLRYTLAGTVHHLGLDYPGTLTFFRAYSNTRYQGTQVLAGQGWVSFSGAVEADLPMLYDPLPQVPGLKLELINGDFWMTFPYSRPLPIDHENQEAHWARFHWEIYRAFRWADSQSLPFSADGTWDIDTTGLLTEPVLLTGARSYYITSSLD